MYIGQHYRGDFQGVRKITPIDAQTVKITAERELELRKVGGMVKILMELSVEYGQVSFVWEAIQRELSVWKRRGGPELSDQAKGLIRAAKLEGWWRPLALEGAGL